MADSVGSEPAAQTSRQSSDGRLRLMAVSVVFLLLGAIGGYFFGVHSASRDLQANAHTIRQLTDKVQNFEKKIAEKDAKRTALEAALNHAHAAMGAIVPSKNTYDINPNHSIIVADGHLTIGLIGSPSDKAINININGKQISAAAGDVVKITPDPSVNCQVTVQSFDMFKAVIKARCETTKVQ